MENVGGVEGTGSGGADESRRGRLAASNDALLEARPARRAERARAPYCAQFRDPETEIEANQIVSDPNGFNDNNKLANATWAAVFKALEKSAIKDLK